jgi:hypothetical protein
MSCYGSFGPISLGDCGPSAKLTIETDSMVKNTSSSIQQSMSSSTDRVMTVQQQNVDYRGQCCKPLVISQGMQLKLYNTSKFTDDFSTKVARTLVQGISSSLDNNQTQITDLLGSTVGPKFTGTIKTRAQNIAESSSFKNSIKTKFSETFGSQVQNIKIDCGENIDPPRPSPSNNPLNVNVDTGCYITQDFMFEKVTNDLFETLMRDLNEDSQVVDIVNEAKNTQKLEGKGLTDLAKAILGPLAMVIIAIVIGLVIFIPLIIWALGGGKGVAEAAKGASEAAKGVSPVGKIFKKMIKSWGK